MPAAMTRSAHQPLRHHIVTVPLRAIHRPTTADTFPRRMKAMGRSETAHGFRSAFRDWSGNETSFPREVCEMALGHVVGNATEAAYRRGDALERRRKLMAAWAAHCNHPGGGGVVPIRRAR